MTKMSRFFMCPSVYCVNLSLHGIPDSCVREYNLGKKGDRSLFRSFPLLKRDLSPFSKIVLLDGPQGGRLNRLRASETLGISR